ncbi:MAG: asparagine synthase (glutamine-hydrolyzing) [Bacteroidota bacterium]|nr:asparagine synthase (glutamine-hydrolyzing) [Bacteroidota bacterium]
MLRALSHRGPDDEGVVEVAPNVWLGNRRLAILDLTSAGRMPMQEPTSGCWITYNGEAYNFAELRRELESKGFRFRSRTDTEVVLAAWAAWGVEGIRRIRGMFALAVYDPRQRELVLARDPVGEKPLYYAAGPRWFAFASEVRALLASGLVSPRLDRRTVAVYLYNGFCVDPITIVEGIRALLPGHYARISPEGELREVARFWEGPFISEAASPPGLEALRSMFLESVRLRLVSDVPLGAFLSGGLDSTAVVAAMARVGAQVRTFTVAFPGLKLDEGPSAKKVATSIRTIHTEVSLEEDEVLPWIREALRALDQPSFDGINTYLVSKAAKASGLTVALSGLGGDELFGGYPFLRYARRLAQLLLALGPVRLWGRSVARWAPLSGPGKLLAALEAQERNLVPLASYQASQVLFPPRYVQQMLGELPPQISLGLPVEFVTFLQEEQKGALSVLDRMVHYAFRIFLGQRTLRDTDTVSMAVSLEVRPPFLDPVLVREAFRLPASIRCQGMPNKSFERTLVRALIPSDYPYRPKQGFMLPFEAWLRRGGPLYGLLQERLGDRRLILRAGLETEPVERLLQRADRVPWSRLWALVSLLEWTDRMGVEA